MPSYHPESQFIGATYIFSVATYSSYIMDNWFSIYICGHDSTVQLAQCIQTDYADTHIKVQPHKWSSTEVLQST